MNCETSLRLGSNLCRTFSNETSLSLGCLDVAGKKDKGEDICGKIYSKIAAVPFFLKQGSLVQCNHTDGSFEMML